MVDPNNLTDEELVLQHFLIEILHSKPDSDHREVYQWCEQNGIRTVAELAALREHDYHIGYINYPQGHSESDPDPPTSFLPIGKRAALERIPTYLSHLAALNNGEPPSTQELLHITQKQYSEYLTWQYPVVHSPPSTLGTRQTYAQRPTLTPAEAFQKSIKKDKDQYPRLTKEEDWEQWYREFTILARSHQLEEILDFQYRPTTPEERDTFKVKQNFAFSVLQRSIQHDFGKDLIRQHTDDGDAQKCLRELLEYQVHSTKAKFKADKMMTYLTTAKFDDTWSLGAQKFILYWLNVARRYNEMQKTSEDRISDGVKMSLLQNAVSGVDDLRRVKTDLNAIATRSNDPDKAVDFKEYIDLLNDSAQTYDESQFGTSMVSKRRRQRLYNHEQTDCEENPLDQEWSDAFGDIESTYAEAPPDVENVLDLSPTDFIQINQTSQVSARRSSGNRNRFPTNKNNNGRTGERQRPFIPHEMWSKLDERARAILLGKEPPTERQPTKSPMELRLKANATTQSSTSDNAETASTNQVFTLASDGTLVPTTIEVQQHSQSKAPDTSTTDAALASITGRESSNIQNVLSVSKSKQAPSKPKLVEVNGRRFLQINMVQYRVSLHDQSTAGPALIDRGANGGLCGVDVRILSRTGRHVDITGIDNHQVNALEVVTAAAKVIATTGPIIIIMNQYAHYGLGKTIHSPLQLEHFNTTVHDKSRRAGGQQCIVTLEGYVIPIHIRDGLGYIDMTVPNDTDMETCAHVQITSDSDWDPSCFDCEIDLSDVSDAIHEINPQPRYVDNRFDHTGHYQRRAVSNLNFLWDNGESPQRSAVAATIETTPPANIGTHAIASPPPIVRPQAERGTWHHNHRPSADAITPIELSFGTENGTPNTASTSELSSDVDASIIAELARIHEPEPPNRMRYINMMDIDFDPPGSQVMDIADAFETIHINDIEDMAWDENILNDPLWFLYTYWDKTDRNTLPQHSPHHYGCDDFGNNHSLHRPWPYKECIEVFSASTETIPSEPTEAHEFLQAAFGFAPDATLTSGERRSNNSTIDWDRIKPCLGFAPIPVIKETMQRTTQFARNVLERTPMRRHLRTRFPAANVARRNEAVATDTVYSDTPAVDNGSTYAQVFIGRESNVADAYGMRSDKEFVNTLEDQIRRRGAMSHLISDRAQVEISKKVVDILRSYKISDWQSEPHHQHQNYFERRYQVIKNYVNNIMNRVGAPAELWLLCLEYVCYLLNHLSCPSLGGVCPITFLTGQIPDISALLQYHFYEPVYYLGGTGQEFPSKSEEKLGYWVGIHETCGDALTYKVLASSSRKVLPRSTLRSAAKTGENNLRLDPARGETPDQKPIVFIKDRNNNNTSSSDPEEVLPGFKPMAGFDPDELIGRTFLKTPEENGERHRMRILRKVVDCRDETTNDRIKFIVGCDKSQADEIMTYNEIVDSLQADMYEDFANEEQAFKFRKIIGHQGPLAASDKRYNGSKYNVLVEWETGETNYQPVDLMARDDPVTLAIYAKENGLLDTPGWKRFKRLAKKQKQLLRAINQSKLKQFRRSTVFKFGIEIPRDHKDAMRLDEQNGNKLWYEAEQVELGQIKDYEVFKDFGKAQFDKKGKVMNAPKGYEKIRVRFVYDAKATGKRKGRLVARGDLTQVPAESVYAGVVSLRSMRLVVFLAELNGLKLWGADIGNAYLEATTTEKVYIVAGPEFGDLEGHILVIHKALYGLRSSGRNFGISFSENMKKMGFVQSKADPCIYMRDAGGLYEYVAVYVDDLCIALLDPAKLCGTLKEEFGYKLKGVGELQYHLGNNYERDKDGTLRVGPKAFIEKMMDYYERTFGEQPKSAKTPLLPNDHPELETSELLDGKGIKTYQSMIGQLQWLVALGRFDVFTAVMTMSRFRAAPRATHLDRLKRIYGYVKAFKHGFIRVRTGEPDYSDIPGCDFDWTHSVYGNVTEELPTDAPPPKGKPVVHTAYCDANLMHDLVTGRAVTAILHIINQTPVDYYCKRQSSCESASYSSEFVAARTAVDQIIDLRQTLRYLGVPVKGKTYLFGDNQSVITSSTFPHSDLKKRSQILCYHRVREAIAAGILGFFFIKGSENPADILSKHWTMPAVWPMLKALLFWMGDTKDCGTQSTSATAQKARDAESNTTASSSSSLQLPHERIKGEYNISNNSEKKRQ